MESSGKILVTGGAGYIGSHTVVELIQSGFKVVIIDNLSQSDKTLISGIEKITSAPVDFIEGDCRDKNLLENIFQKSGPFKTVIHFAALKSVGESVREPLLYYNNNIGCLTTLLEVMNNNEVKDFIFSSSCTVYGQPDFIPVDENAPFKKAQSPYGSTKQMCERILEDVSRTKSIRNISLRYFNPIGAHPTACIGELPIGTPNNLVPYITQTAVGLREKLTVFGDDYNTPDGSCIRDYIHVVDLAKAHVSALRLLNKSTDSIMCEAFNVGSGNGVSVLDLVHSFIRVTGQQLPLEIGARRPGDIEKVYANPAKANRTLDWKTTYSTEDALLHAWNWQKSLSPSGLI